MAAPLNRGRPHDRRRRNGEPRRRRGIHVGRSGAVRELLRTHRRRAGEREPLSPRRQGQRDPQAHARPSRRGRSIAESAAMRRMLDQAERAAAGRSTILLTGETGTGKEHVARRIHERSSRASGPFVAINCAALPEGLLESELFGHEKGAFTGADRRRLGWFELADGGTLLLDEIGDLPAPAQGKLLRVLQEREINRVGGTQAIRVNVRSDRRDASEPRRRSARRPFSRGSLLSSPRRPHPSAAAARASRGHRAAGPAVSRSLRGGPGPRRRGGSRRRRSPCCARITGRATCGSSRISPSDCWCSAASRRSARPNCDGLLPNAPVRDDRADADVPAAPVIDDVSLWEQEHALLVHALERTDGNQTRAAQPAQDQPRATSDADATIRPAAEAVTSGAIIHFRRKLSSGPR